MNKGGITLLLLLLVIMTSRALMAGELEKLVMPGEVISAHSDFEADCDQCHQSFDKKSQNQKCMSCHDHDNIRDDVKKGTGFHGRIPNIDNIECSTCHTDHKGRDADVVSLVSVTFNHENTDFPLKGGHSSQQCMACHVEGKKYHNAPSQCFDCHEKHDPHKGGLGEKCQDCHTEKGWTLVSFDHDRKTDFRLSGKHKQVSCDVCHVNQKYKDTPGECFACHYVNDVHNGSQGRKCGSCHNEKGWSETMFDHDRKTDFPLKWKHAEVACDLCHISRNFEKKLKTDCYSCHKNDDRHKNKYGNKCADCHTEKSWGTIKFQHGSDAGYRLVGGHSKVACNDCHRPEFSKMKISRDCYFCHRADDVHNGSQGKNCKQCHSEEDWGNKVVFDHDLTAFPLLGQHAVLPCAECHIDRSFSDTESHCHTCHMKDDSHKGRFGRDCNNCHNPNDWNLWIFDHSKQTDFRLDGAHKDIGCYQCHKRVGVESVRVSRTCDGCHRNDDVHKGGFGRQCIRCHTTDSFRDNIKY